MFGCMGRIGCLLLVVALAVGAWFTRDRWMGRGPERAAASAAEGVWEPLTEEGATRARQAVASIGTRSGPVFANLRPGDLASYVFLSLQRSLPAEAHETRAAVIGERLYVRTLMSPSDLGGREALGSLGSFFTSRDTVLFGGVFELIEPGLAQYRVEEIRAGRLAIPKAMIPRLVSRIRKGGAQERLAPNGLALEIPAHVGDVRIARGRVTLYKNVVK